MEARIIKSVSRFPIPVTLIYGLPLAVFTEIPVEGLCEVNILSSVDASIYV